jgi:chemotaxis protein MotB
MEISLMTDVLFKPGSVILSDQGKKALDEAAKTIMEQHGDKFITVEGHTDSDQIKLSKWDSNWQLGSARSLAVLNYLLKQGVDPAKSSAATYGPYQPIASNDTKEDKAKNRRAVIVIYTGWPRF